MSNSEEVAIGPVTTLDRPQQLLDGFESAWQRGERPALEKYLPPQDMERTPILVELIRVDLECRIKAGEKARVEEYLDRFPELSQNRDSIIALISHEYGFRKHQQPTPTVEEYLSRFPEYREELTRQGA